MFHRLQLLLANTREHYSAWGNAIMKSVEDRLEGEYAFRQSLIVREQLQKIAARWNPDAKIFLCGSIVTLGVVEKESDIDMCCLIQDLVPDQKQQSKMCEKFWTTARKHIPHHLRDYLLGLAECRTPVVSLNCVNWKRLKHTRYSPLSPEDEKVASTSLLRLKTTKVTLEQATKLTSKLGPERIRNVRVEPNGAGSVILMECADTWTALEALSLLPDGTILSRSQREDLERDFLHHDIVPELLRFHWDCSFMGYSVKNSYLIRKYLTEHGPSYARHCSLAIKQWGKSNYIGVGTSGYMTTYAMTILFLYFLLCTHNMRWIDPFTLPHPVYLPRYPDYVPFTEENRPLPEEVGLVVAEFFKFYSMFDWEKELVSLNRPRRSSRDDLGWEFTHKENFYYHACIEDPYEQILDGGLNLGRWLHPGKLNTVRQEFAHAARQLEMIPPQSADTVFFGVKRPPLGHDRPPK